MSDCSIELKKRLEEEFSMPFEVALSALDGEEQYICYPSNDEQMFFTVKAYIHNQIRLVVEINPQKNAVSILNEMAQADTHKQQVFFQYLKVLCGKRAKVSFTVNNGRLSEQTPWPEVWRFFNCRIDQVPIPENNGGSDIVDLLSDWMIQGAALILSLLTVEDAPTQLETIGQQEGGVKEVLSKRYERSRVNREICLAHKGYSCHVCGFNFGERYGKLGKDYIEVHHTTPVSEMGEGYVVDIDRDLVPVCSNCHSMLHRKYPPYTIKELKEIIAQQEHAELIPYNVDEEGQLPMAAEDIYIYGSIPVDLPNTKREALLDKNLDLILMYAIGPSARPKTEAAGRIAIGIKEDMLKDEQMAAYKSLKYLLFHYWSNPMAYLLTKEPLLVNPDNVPTDYLKRMEKDAVKYLLLEYNPEKPSNIGTIDVLKTQRRGEIRYLPFVTTIESIAIDE